MKEGEGKKVKEKEEKKKKKKKKKEIPRISNFLRNVLVQKGWRNKSNFARKNSKTPSPFLR